MPNWYKKRIVCKTVQIREKKEIKPVTEENNSETSNNSDTSRKLKPPNEINYKDEILRRRNNKYQGVHKTRYISSAELSNSNKKNINR